MAETLHSPAFLASILLDALHRQDAPLLASTLELTRQLPRELDAHTSEKFELLQALAQDLGLQSAGPHHRQLLRHLATALLRPRYNAKSWETAEPSRSPPA